ncbi:MAG: NAD(P)/FAD-dependent oxidoreductase [Candidatus Dormibacteraceae bacterium]
MVRRSPRAPSERANSADPNQLPRVVVVGAGFGGLTATRQLASSSVAVTLVDRNDFHLFRPLLYQAALGLLNASEIAQPVRKVIRRLHNCTFRQATATGVDLSRKQLLTDRGVIPYDYLIVATGSRSNFFDDAALKRRALPLTDLAEGLALRNWVFDRFERASWERDPERRRELLTFVVAGGGPTGVELSGALAELIQLVLPGDFPDLDLSQVRVLLLEGADHLLGGFVSKLSESSLKELRRRGIEVWLNALVSEMRQDRIFVADGRQVAASTLIWTAGVQASELPARLGAATDRLGRVVVESSLQLPGYDQVFVIGDAAGFGDLPMLAQVAIQQGRHAAKCIRADLGSGHAKAFRYRDYGIMATIGRNRAVAQIGPLHLSGLIGWLLWLFVHLMRIVTVRARLFTLLNWAWEYFAYDRPARFIVRAASPPARALPPAPLEDDRVGSLRPAEAVSR